LEVNFKGKILRRATNNLRDPKRKET